MAVKNRLEQMLLKKQADENRRISIKKLAEESGVSIQAIYNWINGDSKAYYTDVIGAFCKYFGCTVGDLLVYEPDEQVKEPA